MSCNACGYDGEAPWDTERGESGEWTCLQCGRPWPFLDFDRLWLAPKRSIEYHGCVDLFSPASGTLFSEPMRVVRVWRTCDDDPRQQVLYSDPPEARRGDNFLWGFRRYSVDEPPALNLATAILHDFYGWLSWVDSEIAFPPYSQARWAQRHAPALLSTITRLPNGKSSDDHGRAHAGGMGQIVPRAFPSS